MDDDRYIIACLDDDGNYRLTTRQTFDKDQKLLDRVAGIAPSRKAIIIACDPNTVILRKEQL